MAPAAAALPLLLLLLARASAVIFTEGPYEESWMCDASGPGLCSAAPRCDSGEAATAGCGVLGRPELLCCPVPGPALPPAARRASEACYQLSQGAAHCKSWDSVDKDNAAQPGEFPYAAALGYEYETGRGESLFWGCGGALIDDRWVLTSAVCALGAPRFNLSAVRLGDLDLDMEVDLNGELDEATAQQLAVERVVPHPEFSAAERYNDIALVRLAAPARRSAAVRPACVLAQTPPTSSLVLAGWGVREHGADAEQDLRKATLPLVAHATCNKAYSRRTGKRLPKGVHEPSQLCAGARGRDSCNGDSGSPLVARLSAPHCGHTLVAISSMGASPCGRADIPSIYTRVSYFLPWITSVVWPEN